MAASVMDNLDKTQQGVKVVREEDQLGVEKMIAMIRIKPRDD